MLINLICGLLGNLFVLLKDMRDVKRIAERANTPFSAKKYFEKELIGIIMGLIPILLYVFLFEEITGKYGEIGTLERTSFTLVGGIGSWLLQLAFGNSKKWALSKIGGKADEQDELNEQP